MKKFGGGVGFGISLLQEYGSHAISGGIGGNKERLGIVSLSEDRVLAHALLQHLKCDFMSRGPGEGDIGFC